MSHLLLFMSAGMLAGLIVGLLGAGSSLIVLPTLIYLLPTTPIPTNQVIHVAAGTTIATAFIGALSAAFVHYKQKRFNWQLLKYILPAYILFAFTGPIISSHINSHVLALYISGLLILLGLRFLLIKKIKPLHQNFKKSIVVFITASLIAMLTSIAGIGSGLLLIPFLLLIGIPIDEAIATSILAAMVYALIGMISFAISGYQLHLADSIGYIYIPALFIALGILLMGPIGAKLSIKAPKESLQKLFSCFVILAGLDLLIGALHV